MDLEQVAAILAAAFVQRGDAKSADDAAKFYFDCLVALRATQQEQTARKDSAAAIFKDEIADRTQKPRAITKRNKRK